MSDLPDAADVSTHELRHGDILIFATDGVWDNMDAAEILRFADQYMMSEGGWVKAADGTLVVGTDIGKLTSCREDVHAITKMQRTLQAGLAAGIAKEAKQHSRNMRRDGPFAKEVQRSYPGEDFHGGKVDDICVVVVVVVAS